MCALQEVIKHPPRSFAAALEILLPRLKPKPDVKGVSVEDQESFVSPNILKEGGK